MLKKMVAATLDTRDKAILMVFLKTGIRRNELVSLDVDDIDLAKQTIKLKETAKRSNLVVFFDEECKRTLMRWLKTRELRFKKGDQTALFLSIKGTRLKGTGVNDLVRDAAERVGLHDRNSKKLEDKFTPHCGRLWFCACLDRNGMRREDIQELRGDHIRESIGPYLRTDMQKLKESYLAHIPQLCI